MTSLLGAKILLRLNLFVLQILHVYDVDINKDISAWGTHQNKNPPEKFIQNLILVKGKGLLIQNFVELG